MTLYDLGQTYLQDEQRLTAQIKAFLPITKTLHGKERHEAHRRLLCLYEMRREARMTADLLMHYYQNKAERRVYHKK